MPDCVSFAVIPGRRHQRVYARLRRAMAPGPESSSLFTARVWIPGSRLQSAPRNDRVAFSFGLLDRLPDRERRRRHGDIADAVVAERIDDGADDDRERWRRAAFAARLDAERIGRRQN